MTLAWIPLLLLSQDAKDVEEAVRLRVGYAEGDRFTVRRIERTTGRTTIRYLTEDEKEEGDILSESEEITRNRVLSAEDGRITALEKNFLRSRYKERPFGAEKATRGKRPLEGKVVVLKREGDRTNVEKAEGIPEADLETLVLEPDPFVASLPEEPVKVGSRWKVDEEALKRHLARSNPGVEYTTAEAGCRLAGFEKHGGVRCAVVEIGMKVDGKGENRFRIHTTFEGKMWIAVETKRYMGIALKGSFSAAAENPDERAELHSSGKIEIREDVRFED